MIPGLTPQQEREILAKGNLPKVNRAVTRQTSSKSARDDYPAIAVHSRWDGQEGKECTDALKEIDYLRRWQLEAIAVIAGWEEVWEAAGRPGPLGGSKAQNLLEALRSDGVIA